MREGAYEVVRSGRLYNVNAGFAYLGLAIIAAFSYYRKKAQANRATLFLVVASALAILTCILTFNRTFLFVSPFLIITSLLIFSRFRVVLYLILTVSLAISLGLYSYREAETVRRQVDERIIIPLKHQRIFENVYYGKRDVLYRSYFEVGKDYFLTGVPPHVPLCIVGLESRQVMTTDISFVSVVLRNGFFSFLVYCWVGWLIYRSLWKMKNKNEWSQAGMLRRSLLMALPFMAIASLNIDILARHYSIVFVALLIVSVRDDQATGQKC
ncbi:MAG: hypothetical protein SWH78_12605 [Thermodesulfobacteriota bacterium]|nr:hypothetical protein [Thermodesulfobacteriota bacterium]